MIIDVYRKMKHSGIYKTLAEIRKKFWIVNGFVNIKNVLKECITCRRLNNRTVKISQNSYRDFRVNPENVPMRTVCADHCGPFWVRDSSAEKKKVYLLLISCLWSRYVNILICDHIDKNSFLRAFQIHTFQYGIPSFFVSDNGSPIVAGVQQTVSYLDDEETQQFLKSRNIKPLQFHPYPAGASELGGFIEILVKEVKVLISWDCPISRY